MGKFDMGEQPCDNYRGHLERNEYAVWTNEHQCMFCRGEEVVSWCENCNKDHHQYGWDTCKRLSVENEKKLGESNE